MNIETFQLMGWMLLKHIRPLYEKLTILDVGSFDVNGTYKTLVEGMGYEYVGCDIAEGDNVDIVLDKPYEWSIEDESYEVVISGQTIEHTEAPWLWVKECERVCKRGGYFLLIGPHTAEEHRFPVDCWRILPDGMEYLLTKHCDFELLTLGEYVRHTFAVAKRREHGKHSTETE